MAMRLGTMTVTISLDDGRGTAERKIPVMLEEGVTPWEVLEAAIQEIQKEGLLLVGTDLEDMAMEKELRWCRPEWAAKPLDDLMEGLDTHRSIAEDLGRLDRWKDRTGIQVHTIRGKYEQDGLRRGTFSHPVIACPEG